MNFPFGHQESTFGEQDAGFYHQLRKRDQFTALEGSLSGGEEEVFSGETGETTPSVIADLMGREYNFLRVQFRIQRC